MQSGWIVLRASLLGMGQLLLHIGHDLVKARPVWGIGAPRIPPPLERCSPNVWKLGDGMPETAVGGIRIDTLQHQLRIEVIKGGRIRRIVWVGSSNTSCGYYEERYATRQGHCQQDDQGWGQHPVEWTGRYRDIVDERGEQQE